VGHAVNVHTTWSEPPAWLREPGVLLRIESTFAIGATFDAE
jgi:hypothetical protein